MRRKRLVHTTVVVVAVLALVGLAFGFGDVVRAAFEPAQMVQPYDPLVRW
ncbi:hypothetical protein [Falsiroseomonas selenitidurans]|uniref:Uncharacterized protein n=1 Tax=Falsiroseomonas selenitidurans TaxID=2716335 RepID=A0ABX1DZ22_9PROT|nr:hypothetical protein [Falsiroseomonas selenitidurans]NKC30155.1 hypothetical protein [Falsiroseomonas selenitidurans]